MTASFIPNRIRPTGEQLDLQTAFSGRRAFTEDLEDQTGAVDYLGVERLFEIFLLDGSERRIDDDQLRFGHARGGALDVSCVERAALGRLPLDRLPPPGSPPG